MHGPRYLLQHLDGGDNTVSDNLPLRLRQGASANGKVLELVGGEKGRVVAIDITPALVVADTLEVFNILVAHSLATDVGLTEKFTVSIAILAHDGNGRCCRAILRRWLGSSAR